MVSSQYMEAWRQLDCRRRYPLEYTRACVCEIAFKVRVVPSKVKGKSEKVVLLFPYLTSPLLYNYYSYISCRSRLSERRPRGKFPSSEHLLPFNMNDVIGAYPTHAICIVLIMDKRESFISPCFSLRTCVI